VGVGGKDGKEDVDVGTSLRHQLPPKISS